MIFFQFKILLFNENLLMDKILINHINKLTPFLSHSQK